MPAKLLGQAKARMIWAGGGAQHASAGILALAERIWTTTAEVVTDIAEEYHSPGVYRTPPGAIGESWSFCCRTEEDRVGRDSRAPPLLRGASVLVPMM